MATPTGILNLPTEMQEMIASFCEGDILNLRLACRQLAAAAYESFTEIYMADLCCFAIDPARLLRISRITSQPHLVRKIRCLDFTTIPSEHSNFFLCPRDGQSYLDAQDEYRMLYHDDQWARHGDSLSTAASIRLPLITTILANIKDFPKCEVRFNASEPVLDRPPEFFKFVRSTQRLPEDLLAAMPRFGVKLSALFLCDRVRLDPDKFKPGGTLWPVLQNIIEFGYSASGREIHPGERWVDMKHVLALRTILENAPSLHEMSWVRNLAFVRIPNMLITESFSSLRVLEVCKTAIDLFHLSGVLWKCRRTLACLDLGDIYMNFIGGIDPWTEIFQQLREMPAIEDLNLFHLAKYSPDNYDGRVALQFLDPEDEDLERVFGMHTYDLDCQLFLEWNLQHGLTYTNYYEDTASESEGDVSDS